ncbi:hypothetical protein L9W97_01850 [Vibrio aestuarianus]|uniref:hypothetical protein n=1 Tax=Vibrio aestuarianus TaxID=28171 RepID=UPI00237CEDEB|nr:hypothetical protein [Vibrio aestuarianus]MDE1323863.1 hypothetical protein [Vibrio aestuarianus]
MSINRVIARPNIYPFTTQGRVFQLLSGAQVHLRFRGIDDTWSEEVTVVAGDSLKFDRDFINIEISSEYETAIEFYAGFADMRRARQELTPVGVTQIKSRMVEVFKGEKMLIEANRNRRRLIIKPLSGEIYIGSLSSSMNDKMPIEYGISFNMETQSAIYAEISPAFERDKVDVRIIEEIN